jgi:anaerobic selenocysteine-containing dehydrogenase
MWGKNAAETNIHQMPFIQRARESGARLVVIDPRRTESAEFADLWLRPRPGTDGALALAVGGELVRSGSVDDDFIREHVAGFDDYAQLVTGCTAEWAAETCEVPVEQVRELARWIADTKPMSVTAGFGMQRYTNAGQTMRSMISLLAITGNIGRSGAGWVYANLQSQIFDEVRDPIACYPPAEPDGIVRVSVSTAKLGRDMLDQVDPRLRMAWVERGNPVTQNPDTNEVLKAFRSLEFRVVVEQFLTDTAREADLVLPAKTMFEQTDVIGAYWHPYVQLRQKVLEPPGEVKPETEIYRLLGPRLGITPEQMDGRIPGIADGDVEAFLEERLRPFEGLSLDRLREGPVLPPAHQEVAFSDLRFPTPSGRIELACDEAASRWGVDRLPRYLEPGESVRAVQGAAAYPLYLMTPNTKNRIHSQFGNLRMIRRVDPGAAVHVHPQDAAPRAIATGTVTRVFNARGEFHLPARLDATLKPGCVSVTNGWWIEEGGTVNFCSPGRETDMGHGAAFHDTLVEIESA